MKRLLNCIRNIKESHFQCGVISVFLFQTLFELDGNIYEFLNQFGLPRPSTIFHLIVIPVVVLLVFLRNEKKKKSTLVLFGSYLAVLGIYFILHCVNAAKVRNELYLTGNFVYNHFQEFIYVFTLVIPYFLIYAFFKSNLKEKTVLNAILLSSLLISVSILLGDIFLFGESTYNPFGTKAPFYTWFMGIYDTVHPRDLASKFFFPEGNTLGIYQFVSLPILYYMFEKVETRKEKILIVIAIVFQSLAMVILATRVATYGTILVPVMCLILWSLFVLLRHIQFNWSTPVLCVAMTCTMIAIYPFTPAYVNQQLDAENNFLVQKNELLSAAKGEGYHENYSKYDPALVYAFWAYGIDGKLMAATPEEYYLYYYDYQHDPSFWWHILTEVPFEQRVNGRQIQTHFNNYKWAETNAYTKLMGMGYSTFMNGSFLLERDFAQQMYTLGYVGDAIALGPWIVFALAGIVGILKDFKKKFTYKNMIFAASFCACMGASYMSGHTLDQYLTTILLSLIVSVLLQSIFGKESAGETE